jgi:WD40 repeat protein
MKIIIAITIIFSCLSGFSQEPELVLPIGHNSKIVQTAISPDGNFFITCSKDGTGKVWNYRTGKLIHDLILHSASISSMDMSSDGGFIVLGSNDGSFSKWDIKSGKLLYHSEKQAPIINLFLLPGDSSIILQKEFILQKVTFNPQDGEEFFAEDASQSIRLFTKSKDRSKLAFYRPLDGLIIYNAETGEWVNSISKIDIDSSHWYEIEKLKPRKIEFIDNQRIVLHCENLVTAIFDIMSSRPLYLDNSGKTNVVCGNSGKYLALENSRSNSIYILNIETLEQLSIANFYRKKYSLAAFSSNDSTFFIYSNNEFLSVSISGVLQNRIMINKGQSYFKYEPTRGIFLTEGKFGFGEEGFNGAVYCYNMNGLITAEFSGKIELLKNTSIDENGDFVFEIKKSYANYWQLETATSFRFPNVDGFSPRSIHTTPRDGIVLLKYYNSFSLFDLKEHKLIYNKAMDSSYELFKNEEDSLMITFDGDRKLRVWDVMSGTIIKESVLPLNIKYISANRDYSLVAGLRHEINLDTLIVWDLVKNEQLISISRSGQEVEFKWGFASYALNYTPKIKFSKDNKTIFYNQYNDGRVAAMRLPHWEFFNKEDSVFVEEATELMGFGFQGFFSDEVPIIELKEADIIISDWQPHEDSSKVFIFNHQTESVSMTLYYSDFQRLLFYDSLKNCVYTSTSDELLVWDLVTKKIIQKYSIPLGFKAVQFHKKMNKLLIKKNDRIGLMSLDDKKPVYYLSTYNSGDFIAFSSDRYYKVTQYATRWLSWKVNDKLYDFDQWDIQFNRPDKMIELMNGANTLLADAYNKAYIKRLKKNNLEEKVFQKGIETPDIEITNNLVDGTLVDSSIFRLLVKRVDIGKNPGAYDIFISVNDVPLFGKKGFSFSSKLMRTDHFFEVPLSDGLNNIKASLINNIGVESIREQLILNYKPVSFHKEKLFFIGIGIDRFAESKYNLQYSAKDIRDLSIKLKEKYGNDITIDTLFNENVTVSNIKALKAKLLKTNVNDKVIVSYSGHGMLSRDYDYFLSTYSVNFDNPVENGLPYDELESLLDSIPARKKLMLIDACHSGEVDKDDLITLNTTSDSLIKGVKLIAYKENKKHLGLKNSFELMQNLFVNVGKSTGATIISAAAGTQFALERNDLKNGVFTYSILEAMLNNKTLKVSELKTIVGKRVEELTKGLQKPTFRNETIAVDWNVW